MTSNNNKKNDEQEKQTNETYLHLARIIGDIFRDCREQKKISLRKIYEDTSISIAVIADLENGKKFPRVETLMRLFNYVGIPLDVIFNTSLLQSVANLQSVYYKRMSLFEPPSVEEVAKEIFRSKKDLLKEALITKGLAGNELRDAMQYINFLLYKKELRQNRHVNNKNNKTGKNNKKED